MKLPVSVAETFRGNYLRLQSTEEGSGLFLCTLTQNSIQDPKDMLRKSALKGLTRPKKSESSVTAQASSKKKKSTLINFIEDNRTLINFTINYF